MKRTAPPYIYAIRDDESEAALHAFYVDDDHYWMVSVTTQEEEISKKTMLSLSTGWECNYKETNDDKADENEDETPVVSGENEFNGLTISLPDNFDLVTEEDTYIEFEREDYAVMVSCGPMTYDLEGLDDEELRDYYVDMMDMDALSDWDVGKKNGTYFLFAVIKDYSQAIVLAFYVDDDYYWIVQIGNQADHDDYDIDYMASLATGWNYSAP